MSFEWLEKKDLVELYEDLLNLVNDLKDIFNCCIRISQKLFLKYKLGDCSLCFKKVRIDQLIQKLFVL